MVKMNGEGVVKGLGGEWGCFWMKGLCGLGEEPVGYPGVKGGHAESELEFLFSDVEKWVGGVDLFGHLEIV